MGGSELSRKDAGIVYWGWVGGWVGGEGGVGEGLSVVKCSLLNPGVQKLDNSRNDNVEGGGEGGRERQ